MFSSVLHHLEDPAATLFDPLVVDRTGQLLRRLDYACWIALHSPLTLLRAIARRLRPRAGRGTGRPGEHIAALAERHAMSGLDDESIRSRVEAAGLLTREHECLCDARYGWVIEASRRLDRPTHFSFILQKPLIEGG